MTDIATERVLAFATMEYARRDGEFGLAEESQGRLKALGVTVKYLRPQERQRRGFKRARGECGKAVRR